MDGFVVPVQIEGEWYGKAGDEATLKMFRGHPGEVITSIFKLKNGRDPVRHNQFFAILTRAVHNLRYEDGSMVYDIDSCRKEDAAVEHLRMELAYAVGFTVTTKVGGKERTIPRSIAFESCTEEDAERFRSAAYVVLAKMLGVTLRELFMAAA